MGRGVKYVVLLLVFSRSLLTILQDPGGHELSQPPPTPPPPDLILIGSFTNRERFSVICTLIDNNIRHHSGQNVLRLVSPQQVLTTVMTNIVVDKSRDNAEPLLICSLLQYSITFSQYDWFISQNERS